MQLKLFSRWWLLLCLPLLLTAAGVKPLIELPEAARSWVVSNATPIYYTSAKALYTIQGQHVTQDNLYPPNVQVTQSPAGEYRVLSTLHGLDEVKGGQRDADYAVLNAQGELQYRITRSTPSDLKPLVPAVSDGGVLALADPVKAYIYFYAQGQLLAEGQLYTAEGDQSLERKLRLQWMGERCYILLERPGFNGAPAEQALFISLDAEGRNQHTARLPFAYLQASIFQHNRFFISGYNFNAEQQIMAPLIIEVGGNGQVLWTNENFGHELAISENGAYLAALNSHESIQIFDLASQRVTQLFYEHNNKISLGLSINDQGVPAVLRVAVDYFVKRNTYFAEIFFPSTNQSAEIQLDPRFPDVFQLYSDGDHFYLGTNYEWLEITE